MYLLVPGLRNSGPRHWQSIWEQNYPNKFLRVQQDDWANPECENWIKEINKAVGRFMPEELVLIGHSVGCAAIVNWYQKYKQPIKAAFLVAPSDVDRPDYPSYIKGFTPMPLGPLPFKSLVIASTNDHVVSIERAAYFAQCWNSDFIELENAGHIEDKSGYGSWPEGLSLLQKLSDSY